MNNGWECENLIHRQDFSLTGEFCDDSYFDILEKQEELKEKYKLEPYKSDALMNEFSVGQKQLKEEIKNDLEL